MNRKKYFIYEKGTYFIARSRNCKSIGSLIGHLYGFETNKELSKEIELKKGIVISLIDNTLIEIDTFVLYKK